MIGGFAKKRQVYNADMKSLEGLVVVAVLVGIVIVGCTPKATRVVSHSAKASDLAGVWKTGASPNDLSLTLNADGSFRMATGSIEDSTGTWTEERGEVHLKTATLGGKPRDQAIKEKVMDGGKVLGETPAQESRQISLAKQAFVDLPLKLDPGRKSLAWEAPGASVFRKVQPGHSLMDEDQIKSNLHIGMPEHEVMAYFGGGWESGDRSSAIVSEETEIGTGADVVKVIAHYKKSPDPQNEPTLQSIETVKNGVHDEIALTQG
jgi:hypothetical protein